MYKLAIGIAFGVLLFSNTAMATCSSYPYTLTNGATADATQVMADFNCAAFSSGSNMTGATISSLTLTGITTLQSGNTTQLLLNNTTATKGNNVVLQQSGSNAWAFGQQSGDNSGNLNFYSYGSASIVLSINYSNNNVTCAGSCISASDQRVKRNIRELGAENGLAAIRRIVPVSFNWAKGDTSATQIGFIAQQVQRVFPQLVTNSGIKSQSTPDGMLALNYGAMSAPIVLALQELDTKVSKLSKGLESVRLSTDMANKPATVGERLASPTTELVRVLHKQDAAIATLQAANDNQAAEIMRLEAQVTGLERQVRMQTAQR